jgi:hypothetical protein
MSIIKRNILIKSYLCPKKAIRIPEMQFLCSIVTCLMSWSVDDFVVNIIFYTYKYFHLVALI